MSCEAYQEMDDDWTGENSGPEVGRCVDHSSAATMTMAVEERDFSNVVVARGRNFPNMVVADLVVVVVGASNGGRLVDQYREYTCMCV